MITFSAFADEIAPDLTTQMDVCESVGIFCIDVRGIDGKNCSAMTPDEARDYRRQLDDRGFVVPCLGSPIGKIKISDDFSAHMDLLKHCFEIARTFGTRRIRMFSFYPTDGQTIEQQRSEVMDRMGQMIDAATQADMILLHENEKAIFGRIPANVLDLFDTFKTPHFRGIFDPANYVEEDIAPFDDGWSKGLAETTDYWHVKDNAPGKGCVPAGEGDGQFEPALADLKQRGWSGYMTLEPHLQYAEQFQGFSGPNLFVKAVEAIKNICDKQGLAYR